MANPTLTWTINKERGTISFGRLLPLTGNTYNLTIAGGTTGESYTFYVMDESGEVCLARSYTSGGVNTIAFNTKELRDQFSKDWHETRSFHCTCSNGSATIAESDLEITWNPVWTDQSTGEAYSMRGPQGVGISSVEIAGVTSNGSYVYYFRLTNGNTIEWVAPIGNKGPATNEGYVLDENGDGKWHKLIVSTNRFGEKTIDIAQDGSDTRPNTNDVLTTNNSETITGAKKFTTDAVSISNCKFEEVIGNFPGVSREDSTHTITISNKNEPNVKCVMRIVPELDANNLGYAMFRFFNSAGVCTQSTAFKFPKGKGAEETLVVKSDFNNIVGNISGNVTGGSISGTSITSSGVITASGNVTAPNFVGNVTGTADNQAVTDYSGNVANTKFVKDYCDTNQAKKDFSDVSEATMRKVAFPKWDEDHITIDYALSVPIGTHEFTIEHDCDLMLTLIGNSSTASVAQLYVNNKSIQYLRTSTSVYANSTLRLRAGDVVKMEISGAVINTIIKTFVRYDR